MWCCSERTTGSIFSLIILVICVATTTFSLSPRGFIEVGGRRWGRSADDCRPGYFVCNGSKICVEQRFNCDGITDCEDGSDEWDCVNKLRDKYYNDMFKKRPDEDREQKIQHCNLSKSVSGCTCSGKSLFCNQRDFREIPHPLPQDVREIDFSGNSLVNLEASNFTELDFLEKFICNNAGVSLLGKRAFHKFPLLEIMYLSGNRLKVIRNSTFMGSSSLRILQLSYNPIQELEVNAFMDLENLEELNLRHCQLSLLYSDVFRPLKNLKSLWLDENSLVTITKGVFRHLKSLNTLSLSRNQLISVNADTLRGLARLATLSLASNQLTYLKVQHFGNMSALLTLDLQDNDIYTIEERAFLLLKNLDSLNLKNNPLYHIQANAFSSLPSLQYIYFSSFYSCSWARQVRVCEPKSDGISSLSHLLDSAVLRGAVWAVAAVACVGNACVLVGRSMLREHNAVHSFYIKNLSVADFLMSLYLFLIAGHDVAFRGEYIRHDVQWRHSWQCSLAGMLSSISSEASVFIMTVITADRYLSIIYPLVFRRRTRRYAYACVAACWASALAIAIVPALNLGYFGDEFYGNNGVCLPLYIHDPFSRGWAYSMAVFCGINSAVFAFIAYAYIRMFVTIVRSKLGLRSSQQQQDRIIAKRFAFIVVTDMLCWVPIIIIKLLAVGGLKIYSELYAWVAVFLLPINSALNPILYTLTTQLFQQQLARIVYSWRASDCAAHAASPANSSGISMSSVPLHGLCSKNSASLATSDLDRSISRSSLISANSRTSARCNWPSPLAYIVYQKNCF